MVVGASARLRAIDSTSVVGLEADWMRATVVERAGTHDRPRSRAPARDDASDPHDTVSKRGFDDS